MVLRLIMQLIAMVVFGTAAAVLIALHAQLQPAPWATELVGTDIALVKQVAMWALGISAFLYIVTCFRAPFEDSGTEAQMLWATIVCAALPFILIWGVAMTR